MLRVARSAIFESFWSVPGFVYYCVVLADRANPNNNRYVVQKTLKNRDSAYPYGPIAQEYLLIFFWIWGGSVLTRLTSNALGTEVITREVHC